MNMFSDFLPGIISNTFIIIVIAMTTTLTLSSCANTSPETKSAYFKVMSYNIRLDAESDISRGNGWEGRKDWMMQLIRYHNPQIFGLQEVMYNQLVFIEEQIEDYSYVGSGRDDGDKAGEFSPIFFDNKLFDALDHGTFWLSETPEVPSKGWDAALNRIVSWAKLRHKSSKIEFYFFNTHFDHVGIEARNQSSKLIIEKVNSMRNGMPFILTGDFNVPDTSEPYKLMASAFNDAKETSLSGHYGPDGSWSTFDVCGTTEPRRRIDFIFTAENITVHEHAILTDSKYGKYPSDHLPVVATVTLP
jgi:endonuclease/exonuclease/phosphatase family metal-dependent hydrolase